MSRFDFAPFDTASIEDLSEIKCLFQDVEEEIQERLPEGRARSLALVRLEESYMWVGKAIRDAQIEREAGFHDLAPTGDVVTDGEEGRRCILKDDPNEYLQDMVHLRKGSVFRLVPGSTSDTECPTGWWIATSEPRVMPDGNVQVRVQKAEEPGAEPEKPS